MKSAVLLYLKHFTKVSSTFDAIYAVCSMIVDDVIVVGMFSEKDNSAYDLYQDAANTDRDKYNYYYTTSEEIRSRYVL